MDLGLGTGGEASVVTRRILVRAEEEDVCLLYQGMLSHATCKTLSQVALRPPTRHLPCRGHEQRKSWCGSDAFRKPIAL
jgi:hypothetical protein